MLNLESEEKEKKFDFFNKIEFSQFSQKAKHYVFKRRQMMTPEININMRLKIYYVSVSS